ncbi:lytic transglycosylase domain-containing protein [Roseicyclus sp.]|uniref:lytic transglycosylase domain-containing protein n=1 Tax=Roseicyclus sp. TaxID=1914329 RepID=UPI003F6D98A7
MTNLPITLRTFGLVRPALRALAVVLTFAATGSATAGVVPDCEAMATRIGAAEGLPPGLLPAISRIESGRRVGRTVRAWPWTLNHAGRGLYFETREETLAYLRQTVAEGPRNIDVGCMQVNHYWHGENFPSVEAMLDPETNIRYAVRFLKELHAREGSWEEAVKNYHSPDAERGARYHRAFETARAAIDPTATGRGDVMTVTGEPAMNGRAAMMAGGLFGQALSVQYGALAPYGASVATAPVATAEGSTESAYAALLALLAERDGADLAFMPAQAELAKSSQSPVLRKQWDRVEAFRELFRTAP